MPQLLEGQPVARRVLDEAKTIAENLTRAPHLTVVLVGDDPASQTYVGSKAKRCQELGFGSDVIRLPTTVTRDRFFAEIDRLNQDERVDGILVQLPLPSHLPKLEVAAAIDPNKDVDGLHPENAGLLSQGIPRFVPCTPAGILEMLRFYGVELRGVKAKILGRSEIVGKPMASLLLAEDATVTICHSKTEDVEREAAEADLLVVAMGKPQCVKGEWVKFGATIIDVGIHRVGEGLVGDVDFHSVSGRAGMISPVPGGVGKLTIACLMRNVATAAARRQS